MKLGKYGKRKREKKRGKRARLKTTSEEIQTYRVIISS